MTKDTLSVPDISCDHCKHSIERAVGALPGVAAVTVEVEPRTVAVEYEDGAVSRASIVATIEEQGYEVAAT